MIKYVIQLAFVIILSFTIGWLMCARCHAQDFTPHQQMVIKKVTAEANRQRVPIEFVLANVELESMFNDIVSKRGTAYGPLQVHVSSVFPDEFKHLRNIDWVIARGVAILKERLKMAHGDTFVARAMFLCGPQFVKSCSTAAILRNQLRWEPVARRWKVLARYNV